MKLVMKRSMTTTTKVKGLAARARAAVQDTLFRYRAGQKIPIKLKTLTITSTPTEWMYKPNSYGSERPFPYPYDSYDHAANQMIHTNKNYPIYDPRRYGIEDLYELRR